MVAVDHSGARRSVAFAVTAAAVAVAAASGPALAQPGEAPLGFADGHWSGVAHWQATLTGDGVVANGLADGTFEVQWIGGTPSGALLASGSGSSVVDGGSAALTMQFVASFAGTPSVPLLQGDSLSVSGTATAQGIAVPVDLTIGADELGIVPLDVRAASCTVISGDFASHVGNVSDQLAGVGTLSAPVAFWSAVRTGDGALLDEIQLETLTELLAAGDAMEQAVHAGTFDSAGLYEVLRRAEQFSYSLARGDDCGRPAGTYAHALSGMVARILEAMIANSGAFDAWDWQAVVLAAAASGLLGPAAGPTGAQYLTQLIPIIEALIDLAAAAGDVPALTVLAMTALTMGAADLAAAADAQAALLL